MRKLSNIRAKITKQYVLGTSIGGLKEIAMMAAFYITILNFIQIAIVAYWTTLREFILQAAPWFTLPIYFLFLIVLAALGMVFEYKVMYPSWYAFRNKQEYEHQSPIKKDLEKIKKQLGIEE